jgi:hypothetical protein
MKKDKAVLKPRSVKISEADWEKIKTKAKRSGVTTSEYIRQCALAGPVYMTIGKTKEIERLLTELNNLIKA